MERTAAAEDIIAFILLLAVIVLISFFIKLGSQQSNGKKKRRFFSNICISTYILCKIYRSLQIYNYFLIKISISGAINVFVIIGIKAFKKILKNVKIFFFCLFLPAV